MSPAWAPSAGEIVWLEFGPAVGTEQDGRRPALVLSERAYNEAAGRILVAPVTSRVRNWPLEVPLAEGPITGAVLMDQIRVVDWRARHAKPAGEVDAETLDLARAKLAALAGLG